MDDADRANASALVGLQRGLDGGRVGAASPVGVQKDRLQVQGASPSRSRATRTSRFATITTASPGESVLTSAASHAPVPEAGKMTTGPFVWKTRLRPVRTERPSSAKSGPRWSIVGSEIARSTRPGTSVGPGNLQEVAAGRASVHSAASSCGSGGGGMASETSRAKARSCSSAPKAAARCAPIGKPDRDTPIGRLIAGTPAIFTQPVKIAWSRGPAGLPSIRSG